MQQTLPNYFNKIGNKKAKGNKECPNDQIDAFVGFFFFVFVCLFVFLQSTNLIMSVRALFSTKPLFNPLTFNHVGNSILFKLVKLAILVKI